MYTTFTATTGTKYYATLDSEQRGLLKASLTSGYGTIEVRREGDNKRVQLAIRHIVEVA